MCVCVLFIFPGVLFGRVDMGVGEVLGLSSDNLWGNQLDSVKMLLRDPLHNCDRDRTYGHFT